MNVIKRRERILEELRAVGEMTIAELAERYDVSEMTVRRDLESLEEDGHARRVRNGAISISPRSAEPIFTSRMGDAADAKALIGHRAAQLIDDGETVIIDGGTTALTLARAVAERAIRTTVITPSVLAAVELANNPLTQVMLPGGTLRSGELSVIGPSVEEFLQQFNCDLFFISTAGVDAKRGLTEYNVEEARVKRAAMESARRVVLLAHRAKIEHVFFANVAPLDQVDVIVTDVHPDHPFVAQAEALGIEVVLVAPTAHVEDLNLEAHATASSTEGDTRQ